MVSAEERRRLMEQVDRGPLSPLRSIPKRVQDVVAVAEEHMIRSKNVKGGAWRTVESFWSAGGTVFFRAPAGARIKVRYGYGIFGFDRQAQILNGLEFKKLTVGLGSVAYARMQIKAAQDTNVAYDLYGDGLVVAAPAMPF